MSIAAALAAYAAAQPRQLKPSPPTTSSLPTIPEAGLDGSVVDDQASSLQLLSVASSSCSSSSLAPSFDSRSACSEPSSSVSSTSEYMTDAHTKPHTRRSEHLAVLLPKQLWKPDSRTSQCDTFLCRKSFSLFERKHHCRKCGGIFCAECSSRVTLLLDTTHLDFIYPPRGVPLASYHSPQSPLANARVCDDCYDQILGTSFARSARVRQSASSVLLSDMTSRTERDRASSPTPTRPRMRRSHTDPSITKSRRSHSSRNSSPENTEAHTPTADSYGELATYPLREHSSICKVNGGGRWVPKPAPLWDGYRVPGCKAPFEVEMERKEEAKRLLKANPIIRDGEFQLRAPRERDPVETTKPYIFSTF